MFGVKGIWLALLVLSGIPGAMAQSSKQAKEALDAASAKYRSYRSLTADFMYQSVDRQGNVLAKDEGKPQVRPTEGKYRIVLPGQELISDGKTQWSVIKEINEVQVSNVGEQTGTVTPANVFTFYQQGYNYEPMPEERAAGKALQVIRLIPQDKRSSYRDIRLRIDKATRLIKDMTVNDKNGGSYGYTITRLDTGRPLSESVFQFNKSAYTEMEIVDLR